MRLQRSLKKDTDYNTSIIILPLVCGFWRRLTKSLGMSLDALSQLIAIVREHVNELLRSTISLTCFSVSFSEPWPWILKLNFPTLSVNDIFDSGFWIFCFIFSGKSIHDMSEFTPTIQSPWGVRLLSLVISKVFSCSDKTCSCHVNGIVNFMIFWNFWDINILFVLF